MRNSLSIQIRLAENNIVSKTTNERLKTNDENFVRDAVQLITIPIVIIIDGLDKVKFSETFVS